MSWYKQDKPSSERGRIYWETQQTIRAVSYMVLILLITVVVSIVFIFTRPAYFEGTLEITPATLNMVATSSGFSESYTNITFQSHNSTSLHIVAEVPSFWLMALRGW